MNNKIEFSFIVTGWNVENEVRECVDSIINQKIDNFEWEAHILDDASTDNTSNILAEYKEFNNIKLYQNSKNMGAAFSRFKLLNQIKDDNKICVILDLDDYLRYDALQIVANVYRRYKECKLTYGNWISSEGKLNPIKFYSLETKKRKAYRTDNAFKASHLRTFKKELANNINVNNFKDPINNSWLMVCTDVVLMFELLEKCEYYNIKEIDEPIYIYRMKRENGTINRFGKGEKIRIFNHLKR